MECELTKQPTWITDVQDDLPGGLEGAGAGLAALGRSEVCEHEGEGTACEAVLGLVHSFFSAWGFAAGMLPPRYLGTEQLMWWQPGLPSSEREGQMSRGSRDWPV